MTLAIFSKHIAIYLDKHLASDQDNSEIYAYGLEILLGAVIKLCIVLFLAWIFNILSLPSHLSDLLNNVRQLTPAQIEALNQFVRMITEKKSE